MTVRRATCADFDDILSSLTSFWDGRDLRALHHPMFVDEFGDTALVCEHEGGGVAAYLFGFVAQTAAVGYVHLVAVRDTERRQGLGRLLYGRFAEEVGARGCRGLKAITRSGNEPSIAFHRALGMRATEVAGYAGPGEDRVVLEGPLVHA